MNAPRRASIHLGGRRGYVLLVALVVLAILTVIGATSLSLAGVDQRIAYFNQKQAVLMFTSEAGTQHARKELETRIPPNENIDSAGDTWPSYLDMDDADAVFEPFEVPQNLGVYVVEAIFQKCSAPPPGYSTEVGRQGFRSDYWAMESTATMVDSTFTELNQAEAKSVAIVRKVMKNACKIR